MRDTYTVRQDLSQDHHLEGLPLGTVGGGVFEHVFPADGEYEFQVRLYRTNLSAIRGLEDPHQIELTIDGERKLFTRIGGPEDLVPLQKNPTDTGDRLEATRLRVRLPIKAGRHAVAAAFLEEVPPLLETNRLQRFIRDFANPYDAEGAPHVQSITIQGPFNRAQAANPPSSQLFVCRPATAADEQPCATRILSTVARRAYRRPLTADEKSGLLAFYAQGRATGSFEKGIGFALRRVLACPAFVFRGEGEPAQQAPGRAFYVNDFELASRLVVLSVEQHPRRPAAEAGRRGSPAPAGGADAAGAADAGRSAGARRWSTNFAGQWLHLRNLRGIVPNSELFPDFDDNLRQAFRREAELFFGSVIRENRSVLDLLTADYTFVNERLARHYRIPGVFGSHFRRVQLTDDARRGLLGKGAVLMVTSHANTTSPVLRGKWVLENVLGSPPPAPPPDVPALAEDERQRAPRTMREQMEQHRSNAACAGCHRLMDPIGFALENFDAVGAWRTCATRAACRSIPPTCWPTARRSTACAGSARRCCERPDVFVQTLTEKLLIYALGRGLSPTTCRWSGRSSAPRKPTRTGSRPSCWGSSTACQFQMRSPSARPEWHPGWAPIPRQPMVGPFHGPLVTQGDSAMFITKTSLPRRTFLRGMGATRGAAAARCHGAGGDRAGADGCGAPRRASASFTCRTARTWPRGRRRPPAGASRISPTLQRARAVQGPAGGGQQPEARRRRGRDARRGGLGLAERRHSQAHRGRGLPRRHDDRPGAGQADRSGLAVPVAGVRDRGLHRLRRRLHARATAAPT